MSTEIFTVNENDSVRLIKSIMRWKNIHHLPVINKTNAIVGIISDSLISEETIDHDASVKDIMIKDIKTAFPEMKIEEAKQIMLKNNIGCLPIIDLGELVGIVTKTDLEKLNL